MADQAQAVAAFVPPPPSLEACRLFCRAHFPFFPWPREGEFCRQSAVLVTLYPLGGKMRMILLVRPANLRRHPGQIGFPGGAREERDLAPVDTALREASEEIGLDRSKAEILGLLPREFAYSSDFCIVPVLAWWPFEGGPVLRPDPVEVEALLTPSVTELGETPNLEWREERGRAFLYPVFPLGEHRLWGASARIVLRFLRLLSRFGDGLSCPS